MGYGKLFIVAVFLMSLSTSWGGDSEDSLIKDWEERTLKLIDESREVISAITGLGKAITEESKRIRSVPWRSGTKEHPLEGEIKKAINGLQEALNRSPDHEFADEALYLVGLNYRQLAEIAFIRLRLAYPNSDRARELER
jgi:hypothetical protein